MRRKTNIIKIKILATATVNKRKPSCYFLRELFDYVYSVQ